jgi:short-subunit dehydrogenase
VFVSSLAAAFPTPGLAIYNATKAGLSNYALSLRGELAGHGIGVSVIHPGPIREAGMWADSGVKTPFGLSTRSPEEVGAAVVDAIERNRAQASVAPMALRAGAAVAKAAPALMAATAPRLGADKLTEAMAQGLRERRSEPGKPG